MRLERSCLAFGLLLTTSALAHEGTPSRFNYRDHVRPIFVDHCGGCHREGGAAPMSLLEYREAVPWANAMKMQVLEQRMPPWLPAEDTGRFRHARSLSPKEIDILIDWAVGQTPEGKPLTAEETSTGSREGWSGGSGGEPDAVLAPGAEIIIGKDEYEAVRCLVLPTKLTAPHVASAFELRPGLSTVVRRATVYLGTTCGGDSRPLVTWLPGQGSVEIAEDGGAVLEAGASLAVELLYVKGWNEEGLVLKDRSEVGIWWQAGTRPVEALRVAESTHRFHHDVTLVALFPDPVGESEEPLRVEAVFPGGDVRPLLVIERYEERWRERYVLADPLHLPSGTEVVVSQAPVWIDFIESPSNPAQ